MSFTTINYEEGNQDSYESVEIHDFNDNIKIFDGGDFVKDWWDLMKYLITELTDEPFHTCSSSVDHFHMDGDNYDSMYLNFREDESPYLSPDYREEAYEFFVPKGTNFTWEQLTEYCKY